MLFPQWLFIAVHQTSCKRCFRSPLSPELRLHHERCSCGYLAGGKVTYIFVFNQSEEFEVYLQWGIENTMETDPLQPHLILEFLLGSYSSCFLACVLLCLSKHKVMPGLCPSLQTSRHPGCALPHVFPSVCSYINAFIRYSWECWHYESFPVPL